MEEDSGTAARVILAAVAAGMLTLAIAWIVAKAITITAWIIALAIIAAIIFAYFKLR